MPRRILELRQRGDEDQLDCTRRSMPMFPDMYLRNIALRRVRVVVGIAVNEHDHIRVLLDAIVNYVILSHKIV